MDAALALALEWEDDRIYETSGYLCTACAGRLIAATRNARGKTAAQVLKDQHYDKWDLFELIDAKALLRKAAEAGVEVTLA